MARTKSRTKQIRKKTVKCKICRGKGYVKPKRKITRRVKKRKYTRRVKKIRMKGGKYSVGNASYTTLTKLSPKESMLASPIPFSKVNNCMDNYNHYTRTTA